ncbi:MAG: ArsR/SmtB family transcription factor [Ignavibacteriales bacterium]
MRSIKESFEEKAEIFSLLSNPIRICIAFSLFMKGPSTVSEIQGCANVPQSSVSQHLAKLKSGGIVKAKRHGNEMHYELVNEDVKALLKLIFAEHL